MAVDKAALFKPRLEEADVKIEGVGTVRVRALSRGETFSVQQLTGALQDRKILHYGMVDPKLTEAEAGKWQHASPAGEIEAVTTKISELSGITQESPKSGLPDSGEQPGA